MPNFELKGKVSLDGSKWKSGLQQAEREAEGFSTRVASQLGTALKASLIASITAGVAAAVGLAIKSLKTSARIRDFSQRIGVTPERFQQLEFAATQSGATGEQVVAAIKGLSKTQQRATERKTDGTFKDRGIRETFAKFGITDEQLDLSPAALFQVIGKRVGEGFNQKDALADLQKLMEESGVALLPVFKAGMEETMKRASELGVIAGSDVLQLAALDDKKTDLLFKAQNEAARRTAQGVRISQAAAVAPVGAGGFGSANFQPAGSNEMIRVLKNIDRNTQPLNE